MRDHAEELVADAPCEIPSAALNPPTLNQRTAASMLLGSHISGIHEDIGVDDEHYSPSMTR